jgi:hypothetical protein
VNVIEWGERKVLEQLLAIAATHPHPACKAGCSPDGPCGVAGCRAELYLARENVFRHDLARLAWEHLGVRMGQDVTLERIAAEFAARIQRLLTR